MHDARDRGVLGGVKGPSRGLHEYTYNFIIPNNNDKPTYPVIFLSVMSPLPFKYAAAGRDGKLKCQDEWRAELQGPGYIPS